MTLRVNRDRVRHLIESGGAQIVDVLPVAEYEEAHLPGAVSIPLDRISEAGVAILDPALPVVVYCHDGL